MIIEELWSKRDEANVATCMQALAKDDLVGALLAIEGASAEAAARARADINAWAGVVSRSVPSGASAREQAQVLSSYLGGELGFGGDADDYYHAQNSQLTHVLARRRGLPIL